MILMVNRLVDHVATINDCQELKLPTPVVDLTLSAITKQSIILFGEMPEHAITSENRNIRTYLRLPGTRHAPYEDGVMEWKRTRN